MMESGRAWPDMTQTLSVDCLTWDEKLRLINFDGPYHRHHDLVEKLKSLGVLEYCEIGQRV